MTTHYRIDEGHIERVFEVDGGLCRAVYLSWSDFPQTAKEQITTLVVQIQRADYEGDRATLQRA